MEKDKPTSTDFWGQGREPKDFTKKQQQKKKTGGNEWNKGRTFDKCHWMVERETKK